MDFLKNIFNIKDDAQPVDVITSGKELRERQEELGQATGGITEELKKQNPDLFNQITSSFTSPVIGNKFSIGDALTFRNALQGNPLSMLGLGMLALRNLPKDSFTDKVGISSFGGDYDPYGYKSALQHGNLGARQDPFGRNISSAFSNYEKNRLAEVAKLSQLQNLTKFQQAKLDFGKDYLDKLEDKRQAEIDAMFARGKGGTGQDFTGGRFDGASSKAEYDADPTGFSGSS
tara:strand:- start:45 stop:740 length:696 start_codon:yes stop_codon:yes gene_type:complete